MKKVLAILLCICIIVGLAACGNSKDSTPTNNGITTEPSNNQNYDENQVPDDVDDSSTENDNSNVEFDSNLMRAELTLKYGSEERKLIESLQGKFSYIANGGSNIAFVADGKWYMSSYGNWIEKAVDLPEYAQYWYFDNMTVGENLLVYSDGIMRNYSDYQQFTELPFNPDTDAVIIGHAFYVLSKNDKYYTITMWSSETDEHENAIENDDGTYKVIKKKSSDVSKIVFEGVSSSFEYDISDIIVLDSDMYGQAVYCITENRDAYLVKSATIGSRGTWLEASTKLPVAENVDKIFNWDNGGLAAPVYSKIGDSAKLYSKGAGESLTDATDNVDVGFVLPDGYTTNNVVDVFPVNNCIAVIFDDGCFYITKKLGDNMMATDAIGNYEMFEIDELSAMNKNKEIKMFTSCFSMLDTYIYCLDNNGTLWAYDASDLVE